MHVLSPAFQSSPLNNAPLLLYSDQHCLGQPLSTTHLDCPVPLASHLVPLGPGRQGLPFHAGHLLQDVVGESEGGRERNPWRRPPVPANRARSCWKLRRCLECSKDCPSRGWMRKHLFFGANLPWGARPPCTCRAGMLECQAGDCSLPALLHKGRRTKSEH